MIVEEKWLRQLEDYIQEGYIRRQYHPSLPLQILNYTDKTQFEHKWDEVTLKCRGLVLDDKGRVVIECPPKFFNHTDPEATKIDFDNCVISEKLDGYYISVRYDHEYGRIITSRGSFDNQYVDRAKAILSSVGFPLDVSYFMELCANFEGDESVIVTKHDVPSIRIWGVREVNGKWRYPIDEPFMKVARYFSPEEARHYLQGEVEGVVLFDPKTGDRVKVKTAWFIERHRLISGCSKKHVWELLKSGKHVKEMEIPDEMMESMQTWEDELLRLYEEEDEKIRVLFKSCYHLNKKGIALDPSIPNKYRPYLFNLYDTNENRYRENLWKRIWKLSLANKDEFGIIEP